MASGEFGSSFGAALQRAGDTEITMPPWVYQKRPEERFDDTLWGDSNTTRRPGRKNRSRQPESDPGKGTGDADDSDDPPAKDEVPLHTRLTEFADAVDSPSMRRTMSSKTPEDELARRADWYRKRWYSIDPNAGFRGKWDLSQAAILLYVAMVVPFRVGYRQPAEGWYVVDLLIDIYFYVDVVLNFHRLRRPG